MKNSLIIFGLTMLFSCKKEMFPTVEKEVPVTTLDCPFIVYGLAIIRPTCCDSIEWELIDYVSDHSPSFFDSVYANNGRLKIIYK